MRSSARSPADRHRALPGQGLALALGLLLGTSSVEADVLAECGDGSTEHASLEQCVAEAEAAAETALKRHLAAATAAQAAYAAITGDMGASRRLEQAQQAFLLYRDLDCEVVELAAPAEEAALSHRTCLIDHNRARAAHLATLAPAAAATGETGIPEALSQTSWRAVAIAGAPPATDTPSTLTIDADGAISGNTGCNSYFGQAEVTDQTITITGLGTTRMACPDPQMQQERAFLEALGKAQGWQIEDQALSLEDSTGSPLIELEPHG